VRLRGSAARRGEDDLELFRKTREEGFGSRGEEAYYAGTYARLSEDLILYLSL